MMSLSSGLPEDESVLSLLTQRNISIKATKCKFGVSEPKLLGLKISATSYQWNPERLKPLEGME